MNNICTSLPTAREGNVFTGVCHSVYYRHHDCYNAVSMHPTGMLLLPPTNEVCEDYVFTRVCQSFCSRGGVPGQVHPPSPRTGTPPLSRYTPSHPPGQVHPLAGTPTGRYTSLAGTPWGRYTPQAGIHPPVSTPPWAGTPPGAVHAGRYGQQAGGTHPTGIHSCLFAYFLSIY